MSPIEKLHETYCQQTGLEVTATIFRIFQWEAFVARGFEVADLKLVCHRLRCEVDRGRKQLNALSFHRLIGDLEYFEEQLAEAKALSRRVRFSKGKEDVLRTTKRDPQPAQPQAKPAKDVIRGLQIAAKLREFREKNL